MDPMNMRSGDSTTEDVLIQPRKHSIQMQCAKLIFRP